MEVIERAKRPGNVVSTEATRPKGLKFCIDVEHFYWTITLGEINGLTSYAVLSDTLLLNYLRVITKLLKTIYS